MKMEPSKSFEAEQLFVDFYKPSLRGLSYVLRHPDTFGFVWDYRYCNTCAIQLAYKLWGIGSGDRELTRAFGVSVKVVDDIFYDVGNTNLENRSADVTPGMVADAIDAYLARQ